MDFFNTVGEKIWPCQVLAALSSAAQAEPDAFPASAQYVEKKKKNNNKKGTKKKGKGKAQKQEKAQDAELYDVADEENDEEEEEEEAVEEEGSEPQGPIQVQLAECEAPEKPKNAKRSGEPAVKGPAKRQNTHGAYQAGAYCASRDKFILGVTSRLKLNYRAANELWKTSQVRRSLLKDVPLPELKRRRFVDKSCQVNPFAD